MKTLRDYINLIDNCQLDEGLWSDFKQHYTASRNKRLAAAKKAYDDDSLEYQLIGLQGMVDYSINSLKKHNNILKYPLADNIFFRFSELPEELKTKVKPLADKIKTEALYWPRNSQGGSANTSQKKTNYLVQLLEQLKDIVDQELAKLS